MEEVAAGRFDQAIRRLTPLAADVAGRDRLLGEAHLGRKEAVPALRHLQDAVARASDDRTRLLLARAHLLSADPAGAVRLLEPLVARGGEGAAAALAAAYRADARYADAIAVAGADGDAELLYERAMSQAALGDAAASLATWDRVIGLLPGRAAAWYGSHGPALEVAGWAEARRRLDQAVSCPGANGKYGALAAAYDRLSGRPVGGFHRRHAYLVDGATALVPLLASQWRLFGVAAALLRHAVAGALVPGMVLEFGVRRGTSLAVIAAAAGQPVHGFDSFAGLPEGWNGAPAGVLTTGHALPSVASDVTLHAGWFEDTLPDFLAAHPGPVRFVNIDCDIYSSARTVLAALAPRIIPGSVLVFDEFVGNRNWRVDEYKAFEEFSAEQGVAVEIVAVNLACKQVAMRVTGIRGHAGRSRKSAELSHFGCAE